MTRYAIGFAVGLVVFVAVPETARWINGGPIAQQTLNGIPGMPESTTVGAFINHPTTLSVTGSPGRGQTLVGGESSVTACPGQGAQNVIGTYVGPGGSLRSNVTVTGGEGGSAIGFRSSVKVGGPGCQ